MKHKCPEASLRRTKTLWQKKYVKVRLIHLVSSIIKKTEIISGNFELKVSEQLPRAHALRRLSQLFKREQAVIARGCGD